MPSPNATTNGSRPERRAVDPPAPLPRSLHPVFRRHPLSRTHVTAHGATVWTPFHAYRADGVVVYGTAKASALEPMVAGTGYTPVRSSSGDGFAQLWLMDYADTSLGAYREAVLMVPVARARVTLRQVNALTAVCPMFTPGVVLFAVRLLLPADAVDPIDYGREVNGLDKHPASRMQFTRDARGRRYEIEQDGARVLSAEVPVSGLLTQLACAGMLVANLGLRATIAQLTRPLVDFEVVTGMPGFEQKVTAGHMRTVPRFTLMRSRATFEIGEGSAFGALLASIGFTPRVASYDENVAGVLEVPTKR